MKIEDLTEGEKQIVYECIKAAAYGPFYQKGDSLDKYFNIEKVEIDKLILAWPNIDKKHELANEIIIKSLKLLLKKHNHYKDIWDDHLSVSREKFIIS